MLYKKVKTKDGYRDEHRVVMEKSIGRLLKPTEQVHHKNGDRFDNRIENLQLMDSYAEHKKLHRGPRSKNPTYKHPLPKRDLKSSVTTKDIYDFINDPAQRRPPTLRTIALKFGVTTGSVFYHMGKIRNGWRPDSTNDK